MNMSKFSGENFVKVNDVRDGSMEGKIAGVREGKYGKPDLILASGDVLSLNVTNNKTLIRAYGSNSDDWVGKEVELFLGKIPFNGVDNDAVLVKAISPADADFNDAISY